MLASTMQFSKHERETNQQPPPRPPAQKHRTDAVCAARPARPPKPHPPTRQARFKAARRDKPDSPEELPRPFPQDPTVCPTPPAHPEPCS
jgi:hypothetical protein